MRRCPRVHTVPVPIRVRLGFEPVPISVKLGHDASVEYRNCLSGDLLRHVPLSLGDVRTWAFTGRQLSPDAEGRDNDQTRNSESIKEDALRIVFPLAIIMSTTITWAGDVNNPANDSLLAMSAQRQADILGKAIDTNTTLLLEALKN